MVGAHLSQLVFLEQSVYVKEGRELGRGYSAGMMEWDTFALYYLLQSEFSAFRVAQW